MSQDAARLHAQVLDRAHGVLDPVAAIDFVSAPDFGGQALFIGRVRDLNHGRAVGAISYDVFDSLALAGFRRIMAQAVAEFGPALKLYAAHAKGRLRVGEIAVVVAAGAPHRAPAFAACRHLIEAIKHESPIWKQEHFLDGSSQWSQGQSLRVLTGLDGSD